MFSSAHSTHIRHARLLRTFFAWALISAFVFAFAPDAAAGGRGRRARLSDDLARRLEARDPPPGAVIITGTRAHVDAIAARHNLAISKRLSSGAVLEVAGGQLGALAHDAEVDQISGDHQVR